MDFVYCECKIKLYIYNLLRANPINNKIFTSLLIGLALNKCYILLYFTYAIDKVHIILSLPITYDSPLTEAFICFSTRPYILLSIHSLACSLAYSPIGWLIHPFILSIYSQSRLLLNNLVHVLTHIFKLRRILSLRSPQQCPSPIRWEALSFAKASLNSLWNSCTQWHISIVMEIRHVVQFVNSSWKSRLSPLRLSPERLRQCENIGRKLCDSLPPLYSGKFSLTMGALLIL
jgi:hypothetical protein